MARVPLIQEQDHPEFADMIEKFRAGRRGRLINILSHAAQRAPARRELVQPLQHGAMEDDACRAAARDRDHPHGPSRRLTIRIAPARAVAGARRRAFTRGMRCARGLARLQILQREQRAVLAYVDTMTRDITVPDAVFAEVKRHFNDREIVELTVLIGTYNMNARVLQALQLDLEPPAP